MGWKGAKFDEVIMQQPSVWLKLLQSVVEKGYILRRTIRSDGMGLKAKNEKFQACTFDISGVFCCQLARLHVRSKLERL